MSRVPPLLAALVLAACSAAPEQPCDLGSPAAPRPVLLRPLTADKPVFMEGVGTYQDGLLIRNATYESCTAQRPTCLSWTAPVPRPLPGYDLQVTPVLPVFFAGGDSTSLTSPDQQPPCVEVFRLFVTVRTDISPPVDLRGEPLTLDRRAARLFVSACMWGLGNAWVGPLSGSIVYLPRTP